MGFIAKTLNVNLRLSTHNKTIKRPQGIKYNFVYVSSPDKLRPLVAYLDQYPLFTTKFLDYQDFRTCFFMMEAKQHLSQAGRDRAKALKACMNDSRTYFNWDHLDN